MKRENGGGVKSCTVCLASKLLSEFYLRGDSGKLRNECKPCFGKTTRASDKKNPWATNYENAKDRCNNKNSANYKRYGGRGIKMLMSRDDVKIMWFRDKAELMLCPTIDRLDPNGNYTVDNCQFLERSDNSKRPKSEVFRRTTCRKGHPYSGNNLFLYHDKKKRLIVRYCKACANNSRNIRRAKNRALFGEEA